jgi:ABC-type glycerol-3-phosphate transport system substrate-binding protein
MLDHNEVLARITARDPGFDWNDFLAGSKLAASYDGKLSGIPYRITTGILVYQMALLTKAGFAAAPGTFADFHKAALAVNAPPDRYAFGLMGKQGAGLIPASLHGSTQPAGGWWTSRRARSSSTTTRR